MEVSLNASMCDLSTKDIAFALDAPFRKISEALSRDYGGTMNHLWIDLELNETPLGRSKPWPFRFQKKVGSLSPSKLTGLPGKVYTNVGHYSVEPDFQKLRSIPLDSVPNYVLSLIYASTAILLDKQKKFAGFDAQKFRADFLTVCRQHGYPLMDAK